jgi:Zn-dependent peptidase ImmA (M78 family)
MDATHELGHLVMHWRHDGVKGRKAEEEAQHFGSAFLMPAERGCFWVVPGRGATD